MKAVNSTGQIFGGIGFAFCMFADYRLPFGMSWFWLSIFYGRHSLLDPVRATKNRSEPSVYASFPFPGWISNPNDMGELVWKSGGFVAPLFFFGKSSVFRLCHKKGIRNHRKLCAEISLDPDRICRKLIHQTLPIKYWKRHGFILDRLRLRKDGR